MCVISGLKKKGKKKKKGSKQKRPRSTGRSGAICAVPVCSYNQRKANNVLSMQCFDHMPLLSKEHSRRVHEMPANATTKRQW